jgi:hypothetical protein
MDNQHKKYLHISEKIERVIRLAEGHGVSSTALETQLAKLSVNMQNFTREADMLIALLEEVRARACENDQQQFNSGLKEAREQLRSVRGQALSTKVLIMDSIIPAARDILNELS